MLLVPQQLKRSGMTGNVPYYGGRMTPAQAYAASHPAPPPQPPPPAPAPEPAAGPLESLKRLRDAGVITPAEFAALSDRVAPC